MSKKLNIFEYIFFIMFLANPIFCMEPPVAPCCSESPEFSPFFDEVKSHTVVAEFYINIQDITFDGLHNIVFDFDLFKSIISEYIIYRFLYLSRIGTWMNENILNMSYTQFSDMCSDVSDGIADLFHAVPTPSVSHNFFYAQKLFTDKSAKVITVTDLHGDINALMRILANMINTGYIDKNLKMRDDCFLIGLGDYVDRKNESLRVLLILLIIALKNPNKVILLRGNHEDLNINSEFHNIQVEAFSNFDMDDIKEVYKLLAEMYELMPSVIYLAEAKSNKPINDFLIFSHAVVDFKFNPSNFLDFDNLEIRENGGTCFCPIKQNMSNLDSELDPTTNAHGFVWHDVGILHSSLVELGTDGRYSYSPFFIENFCRTYVSENCKISGMVGGHQHFFAKIIAAENDEELISSVGIVKLDFVDRITVHIGHSIINPAEGEGVCFLPKKDSLSCFTIVKFVSSLMEGTCTKPTYLVVSKSHFADSDDLAWTYKAVECA